MTGLALVRLRERIVLMLTALTAASGIVLLAIRDVHGRCHASAGS